MRIQAIPIFKDAHILRKSMLEALADYAYLGNQLLYHGYGNGIMAGCELTTTEDTIILNEGVVFFEGQMFLIKEQMSVPYYPTNTTTILKLCISKQMDDGNFSYREMELRMEESEPSGEDGIELCRFKLQEGARLRYKYQDFEDRSTEFDTLNIIHAPYATKRGSTLSPDITKAFALEMLDIKELPQADAEFCLQLLGRERPADKDMLTAYIQWREKKTMEETSNTAIYRELLKILKKARQEEGWENDAPKRKRWKMTVE